MNRSPRPSTSVARAIDRRTLLRSGGLALSLGAIVAACGDDRGGLEEPGRIGVAPPRDPLPDAPVNDVVLLRTAQSIEHTAVDLYGIIDGFGVLDGAMATTAERFTENHVAHAATVGALITARGGEQFACANPWIMDRVFGPVLEAMDDTDDLRRDALNLAHSIENLAGATYQLFTGFLGEAELRQAVMAIGAEDHRQAAALAMRITGTPEAYFSPALEGLELEPDEAGVPIPYAVTARFGQLGAKELVVGSRDAEGVRFSTSIQTPAENSYVYEYMTC